MSVATNTAPGKCSVVPYTNSAELHPRSDFKEVRIPSITKGSASVQVDCFR